MRLVTWGVAIDVQAQWSMTRPPSGLRKRKAQPFSLAFGYRIAKNSIFSAPSAQISGKAPDAGLTMGSRTRRLRCP
jgi:hypothetical protein